MARLVVLLTTVMAAMVASVTQLPHWDTLPALAEKVGLSEWTIRKEIRAGRLRARIVGRCVRVLDEDAAAWMRGRDEAS